MAPKLWRFNFGLILIILLASCLHQRPPTRWRVTTAAEQRRAAVLILVQCGSRSWRGSGAAVGPHRVLTARHVADCPSGDALIIVRESNGIVHLASIESLHSAGDTAYLLVIGKLTTFLPTFERARVAIDDVVCWAAAAPQRERNCATVQEHQSITPYPANRMIVGGRVWRVHPSGRAGNSGSAVYDRHGRVVGVFTLGMGCASSPTCYDGGFDSRF